jgi:hypothetical protein
MVAADRVRQHRAARYREPRARNLARRFGQLHPVGDGDIPVGPRPPRFPFDHERLEVRIQSFIWTLDQMVFVSDPAHIGFNPRSTYEELAVRRVSTEIRLPSRTPSLSR